MEISFSIGSFVAWEKEGAKIVGVGAGFGWESVSGFWGAPAKAELGSEEGSEEGGGSISTAGTIVKGSRTSRTSL